METLSLLNGIKNNLKISVKHQGKDIHHLQSINDPWVTFLARPFALPFPRASQIFLKNSLLDVDTFLFLCLVLVSNFTLIWKITEPQSSAWIIPNYKHPATVYFQSFKSRSALLSVSLSVNFPSNTFVLVSVWPSAGAASNYEFVSSYQLKIFVKQ